MAKADTPADPFAGIDRPASIASSVQPPEPINTAPVITAAAQGVAAAEPSGPPKFFDFDLALAGDIHHVVRKQGVTYPEIAILAAIHGGDAIGARTPTPPDTLAQMERDNPGCTSEGFASFRNRMVAKYGRARVAEAFALLQGGMPSMPAASGEGPIALPGQGFVGA